MFCMAQCIVFSHSMMKAILLFGKTLESTINSVKDLYCMASITVWYNWPVFVVSKISYSKSEAVNLLMYRL